MSAMDASGLGLIQTTSKILPPGHEERVAAIAESHGLDDLDPEALEVIEFRGVKYFAHRPDGTLWTQTDRHAAGIAGRTSVRVVLEGRPVSPRYLIRARNPSTLAELEQLKRGRDQAVAAARKKVDAEHERQRKTARPVTAADLDRNSPATLRAAGEAIEQAAGTVKITDGRVVVHLPPSVYGYPGRPVAVAAARVVYLAEAELLANCAPGRGGRVDPAALPDKPVLPSGRLTP